MIRIGEVARPSMLAEIDARRREYKAERCAEHGWPADVACPGCGDSGRVPESGAVCRCGVGGELAEADRIESDWADRIPARFRGYRLGGAPNRAAAAAVEKWLTGEPRRPGRSLVLAGPVGTGKTGLAVAALRSLHEDGVFVRFFVVPALLDAMRPPADPTAPRAGGDVLRLARQTAVLCLDDLGAEKPSEWAAQQLYLIVNARYEAARPTVVTTNRTPADLAATVGERTVSRLVEDAAWVVVGGTDHRRAG